MTKMTQNTFITKAKEILNRKTVYQYGGAYCQKEVNGKLITDCSGLIKGILWGYPNVKYGSNGVQDCNANTLIKKCSNVTTDFTKAEAGWLVWMEGHIGIYIGNGQVIESTPIWANGVQLTFARGTGYSNSKNLHSRQWTKCGKLDCYIDYIETVKPSTSSSSSTPSSPSSSSTIYYPKYTGKSGSIVAALNSLDINSTYANRSKIAKVNGINNYTGTATQNTTLLNLLKNGKLKKSSTASTSTSTSYYPKYTGKSGSIATALNSLGINSSYTNRSKIAKANGISNYIGTASQNTTLLNLLKNGKLKKY